MKHKKLASLCAAVLMVGCLSTSAFASSAPLSLPGPTNASVEVAQTVSHKDYEAVLLNAAVVEALSDSNAAADPSPEQAPPPEQPQGTEAPAESGGFINWYMGLFNNPVFVLGFVGAIGIVALVLFTADLSKKPGKKGNGRGSQSGKKSSRADGL